MTTTMARIRELFESGDLGGGDGVENHGNEAHSTNFASQSDFDSLESRVTALEDGSS